MTTNMLFIFSTDFQVFANKFERQNDDDNDRFDLSLASENVQRCIISLSY